MIGMLSMFEPNFGILIALVITSIVAVTWIVRRIRRFRPAPAQQAKVQTPPRRLLVGQLAAGGARVPDIARRTGLAQDAVRVLLAS